MATEKIGTTESTKNGLTMTRVVGSGTPLLFLPPLWGKAAIFRNWLAYSHSQGRDAYALEMRGRPGSRSCEKVGKVGVGECYEDWVEGLEHIGRSCIIIGHSFGGLGAQMLADHELAEGIVLVNSVPTWGLLWHSPLFPIVKMFLGRWRYIRDIILERPVLPSLEDGLSLGLGKFPDPRAIYNELVPDSGRVIRQLAFGGIKTPKPTCPALVVLGGQDRIILPDISRAIAWHYGVTPNEYLSSGHLMMLEEEEIREGVPRWKPPIHDILGWTGS